MQPIIVIAVIKLGTNNVKPFALFAKLFAAVPNMTASIRTVSYTHLTLPTKA